jgi:hypothetical protein
MHKLFKPQRSCTQLGELIADGLDAGFVSLLGEFQKNADKLATSPEAIAREVAFLEVFIAERAVNRMISERRFQDAILFALIRRLVSLSGILPDGQAFQDGYDSRWDTYTLYWREPLDGSAGMALVTQVMSLSKASYHYGLIMYLVQRVAKSYTDVLRLLSDFQKEFGLTL